MSDATSEEFVSLQRALAGEYSLQRELGRGGMGIVYLARDVQLDRNVAIKVLPGSLARDDRARERLLREARTAAGLSHPNIVPIHRVGEAGGHVFIVMSFVAGETLGERLRRAGALSAAEAMKILREVAWALAYAHRHGIVHRDVKPDNILIEEGSGRAMVTDFGIAHVGATTLDSNPGRVIGTAQFMSPEQAMNEAVDGRSDLYALGVVAYLSVSGQLPFEASSVPALLLKQVSEPARPIAAVARGIPPTLAEVIERCLAKDPAQRFPDGETLAGALAPGDEGRGALPAPLRAWLSERNPATVAYAMWSGLVGIPLLFNLNQFLLFHRGIYLVDMAKLLLVAAVPLVPILNFHMRRAGRLFRAGYSLADVRAALDVGDRERESDLLTKNEWTGRDRRAIRVGLWVSAAVAVASTFFTSAISLPLELRHIVIGYKVWEGISLGSWFTTLGLLLAGTMTQTRTLPLWLSRPMRGGLREKLWRSRLGEALARRLGAPDTARPSAICGFQATEVALGVAAGELFAALPQDYRDRLRELPPVIAALEQRAAAARREIGAGGSVEGSDRARTALAATVAALEGIRLDLLRLHAGNAGLAPLTTLIDAARLLGEDMTRLAEAQREVSAEAAPRRVGAERVATPV